MGVGIIAKVRVDEIFTGMYPTISRYVVFAYVLHA